MVFNIAPAAGDVTLKTPVEFLLVKDGDTAPATLNTFRKTVTLELSNPSNNRTDYDLVMAHKSALLPSGKTSLYLAHDSAGRYP